MKPILVNYNNKGVDIYEDGTYTCEAWGGPNGERSFWKIVGGVTYFRHPHMLDYKPVKDSQFGAAITTAIAEREIFGGKDTSGD